MVKVECQACLSFFSPSITSSSREKTTNPFLFFPCGHGMCRSCMERDAMLRDTCHSCRRPKGTPIQLFVDFFSDEEVNAPEKRAETVSKKLGKIDKDTPGVSLKRAVKEIRGVVQRSRGSSIDTGVVEGLLESAKSLEERLAPVLSDRDELRKENSTLREEGVRMNEVLAAKVDDIVHLRWEVDKQKQLAAKERESRKRKEKERDEAVARWMREGDTNRQLKQKYEGLELELEQLKKENAEYDKQIRLLRLKNKVLVKKSAHSKPSHRDPDESLQIEPPLSENTTSRRSLQDVENKTVRPSKRKKVS
ncbi:hypothetical protein BDQ17DRAFT_1075137 [Cyathus striatus]|nr:hypothetical protein BDQ17DRAFT_1075137 [Cyathus striatus]